MKIVQKSGFAMVAMSLLIAVNGGRMMAWSAAGEYSNAMGWVGFGLIVFGCVCCAIGGALFMLPAARAALATSDAT